MRPAQCLKERERAEAPNKAVYFFVLPVKYPDGPSPVNNISESSTAAMLFIGQISAGTTYAALFHIL